MYAGGFIVPQLRAFAMPLNAASRTRARKGSAMVGRISMPVIVLAFTKTAPKFKRIQTAGMAVEEDSESPLCARRISYRVVCIQRAPV